MHENAVEVSRLHGADLDGLLPPTHDLVGVDVGCRIYINTPTWREKPKTITARASLYRTDQIRGLI